MEEKRTQRILKEIEPEEWDWEQQPAKYYIRSTVLGGAVVTDAYDIGTKKRTYVRAGGQEIAWQNGDGGGSVVFQATDPAGASIRSAESDGDIFDAQGTESSPAELDPMGGNVATESPFVTQTGGSSFVGCGLLDEDDVLFVDGQRQGFTLNGFSIHVEEAFRMMAAGSAHMIHNDRSAYVMSRFGLGRWIDIDGESGTRVENGEIIHFVVNIAIFEPFFFGWVTKTLKSQAPGSVVAPSSNPCQEYGLLQRFNKLRDDSSTVPIKPYIHKSIEGDFQAALDEINRVVPEGIGFTEMYRTFGYQKQLYDAWVDRGRTGNQVAVPGTSRHEGGFAFDVKGMGEKGKPTALAKLIIPIFEKYGFRWGGRFRNPDPPHFEADFRRGGYKNSTEAATAARNYFDNCIVEGREGLGKAQ